MTTTHTHSFQGQMTSHSIITIFFFLSTADSFEVRFGSATATRCQKADVRHEQMKVYRVVIHLKEAGGWYKERERIKKLLFYIYKCMLLACMLK